MAASDPTPYVATPTGTLQGVAAFSWDGSAWQPSGRAGPDVATPTGVLQGVAPFSWSGSAWTPAGRAQPGVAAPGGVLDGVAVYTWSGSAWLPASGTATPSTPSGALRGVAAFNWDGAAWQPVGQARPSVPTPYGVLDGVAMFGWTGSAWAAVQGPSLDLSFMTPGTLDARITFVRATTGTYFDAAGTLQTAAINAPRWDYDPITHALRGLLIEEARQNFLLNSATLNTQGVAVTAQAYTLSFYGTGTVTMSGAFAGSLVGTGAFPTRVQTVFTPAAGTLTCTVTGSVLNAQLEAGNLVTSYIPTAGASGFRSGDFPTMPTTGWLSATTGTLLSVVDFNSWPATGGYNFGIFTLDDGAGNRANVIELLGFANASTFILPVYSIFVASANVGGFNGGNASLGLNVQTKIAVTWTNAATSIVEDGGALQTGPASNLPALSRLNIAYGFAGVQQLNGHIKQMRYWPRVLSTAELQAATT